MLDQVKSMAKEMGWFVVTEATDVDNNVIVYLIEDENTGGNKALTYEEVLIEYQNFKIEEETKRDEW